MKVYLNEYNIRMEKSAYLPIATGMLRAYAQTREKIRSNYEFQPFFYHIDSPDEILRRYDAPAVAAFSVWMWNERLVMTVAQEVKRRWPECLIVMGGLHVPHNPQEFFASRPFLDVAVRAEGEEAFSDILERYTESRDFSEIPNVSWRHDGEFVKNLTERKQPKDLDFYPSPYIEGLFDDIVADGRFQMQATIETNRGCPFPCAFCAWGNHGLSRKYRFHGVDRVREEIEWAAKNKIRYLFNADSNFGMHKRDEEIAQILVDTKTRYGFPEKFRTCFGKNADERIYGIAKKLHDADMEKGITLALQSNDPIVLKNIRRENIKMETYRFLQRKFNDANVPVYSEMILGLPGETFDTWKTGIEVLLQAGLKNQLFVYLCQILPNTQMSEPEYQKEFGIVTKRIQLNEIHGAVRTDALVTEYEDIIVATNSMPTATWRQMVLFSWVTMVLHSLKVGFFVLLWLHNRHRQKFTDFIEYAARYDGGEIWSHELAQFNGQIERLLSGLGRGREMPGYAPIYWDEEEASFLRLSERWDAFYYEFTYMVADYLTSRKVPYSAAELSEVVHYQRLRMPSADDLPSAVQAFQHNVPEYFERVMDAPVDMTRTMQPLTIYAKQFQGDKPRFAKETIMWGRKSGTIMTEAAAPN